MTSSIAGYHHPSRTHFILQLVGEKMASKTRSSHGSTVRGLTLPRGSKFFGGQFGRMFRALPPADYGDFDTQSEKNLLALGKAMVADPDPVKDGPDAEESGIPAVYTYLGQFID